MNILDYIPTDKSPQVSRAIRILFTPEEAKKYLTPFTIATNELIFYGNPVVMMTHSELIYSLPNFDSVHLATKFTLTETNIKSFVYVWLLINGIDVKMEMSLLDLLLAREWGGYFGLLEILDIDKQISLKLSDNNIQQTEKDLLMELYKRYLDLMKYDKSYMNIAAKINGLFGLNDIDKIGLASKYHSEDLYGHLLSKNKLTSDEIEWGNFMLKNSVESLVDSIRDIVNEYKRAPGLPDVMRRNLEKDVAEFTNLGLNVPSEYFHVIDTLRKYPAPEGWFNKAKA